MTLYILSIVDRKKLPSGAELINTKVYNEQKLEDVTIWKTDKDGKEFPNFDSLKEGDTIEANFWRSPTTGKASLYPPKAKNGTYKPKPSVQEKVTESVQHAQDRKEISIKVAGTASQATQILTALIEKGSVLENWEDKWLEIRSWLWSKYDTKDTDHNPY